MENKLARFMRNTGNLRVFLPLGLILIVVGVIMYMNSPSKYAETTAKITNVNEYKNNDNETVYDYDLEFTVDGKTYTSIFAAMPDKKNVGDTVTIYYDPANPESTSNTKHTGMISVVMAVAGVALVAFSVLSTVKKVQKSRELDAKTRPADGNVRVAPLPKDQLTEYYVAFDGSTLKPGYTVEDKNRKVVYEMTMTKQALVGARTFEFRNKLTGRTQEHAVGHTTTVSYNNEIFSQTSWFSIDGKNVWDVLHEQGVRIDTDIASKFPKMIYTMSQNGRFFATIETSSMYIHEEDEAQHKIRIPYGKWYYRCWTNEQNLDLLFLTVFAISETEQAVVE